MDLDKIFQAGIKNHHYANTAYPLKTTSFKDYRIKADKELEKLFIEDWSHIKKFGLYIHIPFCAKRCKFCEYCVVSGDDKNLEDRYVDGLLHEVKRYGDLLKGKEVTGFDIGGGTPSYLSKKNIIKLTNQISNSFNINNNTIFSVETTPEIASTDFLKIKSFYESGFRRISMGVQTINTKLLELFDRKGSVKMIFTAMENLRDAGFEKINIDLMYGFLNQKNEDFLKTIEFILDLKPEYVTLYQNRYKGTKLEGDAKSVSLKQVNKQYQLAYNLLNQRGYATNIGKNTFSRIENDYGTSDYLTQRVIKGLPYLGLGLGAQSYGHRTLSYNSGAANKKLNPYFKKIENNILPIQDFYKLPIEEMMAKMISVAFYFGYIDLIAFKQRFNISFENQFKDEIIYLTERKLMKKTEGKLILTSRGADVISGIIPLFYSEKSRKELIEY